MSIYQDWDPVVFNKTNNKSVGGKIQNAPGTKEFKKLIDDDIPVVASYTVEHSSKLICLRNQKGVDRKELARKCNINIKDIEAIENRNGKFNKVLFGNLIRTLERLPDKEQS
jgi:hypothetical protein